VKSHNHPAEKDLTDSAETSLDKRLDTSATDDPDLAELLEAWPDLRDTVKRDIIDLARENDRQR